MNHQCCILVNLYYLSLIDCHCWEGEDVNKDDHPDPFKEGTGIEGCEMARGFEGRLYPTGHRIATGNHFLIPVWHVDNDTGSDCSTKTSQDEGDYHMSLSPLITGPAGAWGNNYRGHFPSHLIPIHTSLVWIS